MAQVASRVPLPIPSRCSIGPFEVLSLFVLSTSVSGLGLLMLQSFSALRSLSLGSVLCFLLAKVFHLSIRRPVFDARLCSILLIAACFRALPYLYIPGGQDQGIYVSMAPTYERTGSPFYVDSLRITLQHLGLGKYYDKYSIARTFPKSAFFYDIAHHARYTKNKYEGWYLPGIYISDLEQSKYVFQFLPLHPIWMAIAGRILGWSNEVYALVCFSLFSIAALYYLTFELTRGRLLPSCLVGIFLATNPLHAFFSKFPVSEVVFLAF